MVVLPVDSDPKGRGDLVVAPLWRPTAPVAVILEAQSSAASRWSWTAGAVRTTSVSKSDSARGGM